MPKIGRGDWVSERSSRGCLLCRVALPRQRFLATGHWLTFATSVARASRSRRKIAALSRRTFQVSRTAWIKRGVGHLAPGIAGLPRAPVSLRSSSTPPGKDHKHDPFPHARRRIPSGNCTPSSGMPHRRNRSRRQSWGDVRNGVDWAKPRQSLRVQHLEANMFPVQSRI